MFDDEYLTWGEIARASGVEESAYSTRLTKGKGVESSGRTKHVEKAKSSSQRRTHTPLVIRDEEEVGVEEDDEEEIENDYEKFDEENMDEEDDFVKLDDE